MVEVAHPLDRVRVRLCTCGRKPLHVETRGRGEHFLECPRCELRTAPFACVVDAITAWEHGQTRPWSSP
jgi:hypothetical protein